MKKQSTASEKLEKNRSIFFKIGLICALSISLLAFEYKTDKGDIKILSGTIVEIIDFDEIPITKQIEPEKPQPKIISPLFEIVDNKTEIKTEIEFQTELTEITEPVLISIKEFIEDKIDELEIVLSAEKMPEFPGGQNALKSFLKANIKYPQLANEIGISGTVHISFVVEPDGSLTHIEILKSIGGGCDEEALRVINLMPRWIPAEQGIRKVRFKLSIPIVFKII